MESLNRRALRCCDALRRDPARWGIRTESLGPRETLIDFGVDAAGNAEAGLWLARICWADLGDVSATTLEADGQPIPGIRVQTAEPLRACMASQYAGWRIAADRYVAMCSGPIRAVFAGEPVVEDYDLREQADAVVGVLESGHKPTRAVFDWIRSKLPPAVGEIVLCVAPTDSPAARTQIVARSVETACHKLFDLKFDLRKLRGGTGAAPLPPASGDDLRAMGITNDAILLAARVQLDVDADDEELAQIGGHIPSSNSPQFGRPFGELFAAAGHDFYRIDPALFAPAEITLRSTRSGQRQTFGAPRWDLYAQALDAIRR